MSLSFTNHSMIQEFPFLDEEAKDAKLDNRTDDNNSTHGKICNQEDQALL